MTTPLIVPSLIFQPLQRNASGSMSPIPNGKLWTYAGGTVSTPKATYTDKTLLTPLPNPVVLDADGIAEIWLGAGTYKFLLTDANDVVIYPYPIDGIANVIDQLIEDSVAAASLLITSDLANSLDVAKGDALIGVKLPLSSTTARTQHDKNIDVISVKDWGAVGDGITDDGPAIQLALNNVPAGGCVLFPHGTYISGQQLVINADDISVKGIGRPSLKAKDGVNFEHVLYASACSNLVIESLVIDANKNGRYATQNIRFCGLTLVDCIDCTIENVVVKNTRGYASTPATGIALGGNCQRCHINIAKLLDCGEVAPNTSDGIYTSGTDNLISNSIAKNCTDTGFVIEESNNCGIVGCIADTCNAGAAITNILDTDCGGNFINGLTIRDWNANVTGGLDIGCPVAGKLGNLLDTVVSNVTMTANVAGGKGAGPAFYVRTVATGKVKGLTVSNLHINGASTQGFVVEGDDVSLIGGSIKGCGNALIQWQNNSKRGYVNGMRLDATGAVASGAVIAAGNADLEIHDSRIDHPTTGIYAADTSTIRSFNNTIMNASITYESKDVGATLERLTMLGGQPSSNGVAAGAPGGSVTKKLVIYDQTGNVAGTIPLYT